MSFAVDSNIVIYAFNRDSEFHEKAKSFIESKASMSETWAIPWPTVHAFLRITTHPSILTKPLSCDHAWDAIHQIIDLPHVRLISEDDGQFRDFYERTIRSMHIRGNLLADAHLAALLYTHGISVFYTNDRDFTKFKHLKVRNPLE